MDVVDEWIGVISAGLEAAGSGGYHYYGRQGGLAATGATTFGLSSGGERVLLHKPRNP
jgi:hypothetical protein